MRIRRSCYDSGNTPGLDAAARLIEGGRRAGPKARRWIAMSAIQPFALQAIVKDVAA